MGIADGKPIGMFGMGMGPIRSKELLAKA